MSLLNILRQRALCRTPLPTSLLSTRHVVPRLTTASLRSPIQHPTLTLKRLATSDAAAKARTRKKTNPLPPLLQLH